MTIFVDYALPVLVLMPIIPAFIWTVRAGRKLGDHAAGRFDP